MPWKESSVMSLRKEFVRLASTPGANRRALMRRFEISAATGYKWLSRYLEHGEQGLVDQSRRPRRSPGRVSSEFEQAVLALRAEYPAWGARKLRRKLELQARSPLPAMSTVHAVLRRHGCIQPEQSLKHRAYERFEREYPNELWQMDFKGDFALGNTSRCHALAVVDDHSRFSPCLEACANERTLTVRQRLEGVFRRYGMPEQILVDYGAPWGDEAHNPHTGFSVWLMRLGIRVLHGRPYHPQTRGKIERFNKTLDDEVLHWGTPRDLPDAQRRFDRFRYIYNYERPHQSIGDLPPIHRYQPSARSYPEHLPAIEYGPGSLVRKVDDKAQISFRTRRFRIGKAFRGYPVKIIQSSTEGLYDVYFMHFRIVRLNMRTGKAQNYLLP